MCIRVGSFIEGIKSISMEKLDREHSLFLFFFSFFFKGNDRSRKIFVRVVSFGGGGSSKGKKSLGVMEQWCCGFVTIEETRMKEGERNNEINGKQGQ